MQVHLCRLKLMNGRSMTEGDEEMPETTTKWRDECSKTLMTTVLAVVNILYVCIQSPHNNKYIKQLCAYSLKLLLTNNPQ